MVLDRQSARQSLKQPESVILVVGFPSSVHTARWINAVQGRGIRFILVPSTDAPISETFSGARLVRGLSDLADMPADETPVFDLQSVPDHKIAEVQAKLDYQPYRPDWMGLQKVSHPAHLIEAIRRFNPVVVHSLIVQFGGYLCFACKAYLGEDFPRWLLSNWGSDIYLFRKLPGHDQLIRDILQSADAYHAECERDIRIARDCGFRGFAFPVLPATGGSDFDKLPSLSELSPPSARREILIKGYHGWSGRGLHILAAVHLAAQALRPYKLRVAFAGPAVRQMSATLEEHDGLEIVMDPYFSDHRDAVHRLTRSRLVVSLGISDGISTTLLEAMTVGSFPIQSSCSCGNEWIRHGETGMLIEPDDVSGLAAAIRRAVTDDELVDNAAGLNRAVVEARWDAKKNGAVAFSNYCALIESPRSGRVVKT